MKHLDPTVLALAALGEELDDDGRRHLLECGECAAEVEALSRVTATARSGSSAQSSTRLEPPESEVWSRIHRELELPAALAADPLHDDGGTAHDDDGTVQDDRGTAGRGSSGGSGGSGEGPGLGGGEAGSSGSVSYLAARNSSKRRVNLWLAAAAAAGIVVGGGAVWGLSQWTQDAERDVVAQTELEPLPGYETSGEVRVTSGDQGVRTLVVTAQDAQTDGFREVWLISEDLEQMYSLGVLAGNEGTFAIPEGVELSQFPIVDISDEPTDGNPEHSGVSVLRGSLSGEIQTP